MRELILDTNLLLSFVTDRHPGQQEKVAELFLSASRLKTMLLCPQHVITEFVYVLEKIYRQPKKQVRQMVADFMAWPGVQVVQEIDFKWVLAFWPDQITDFGDALVAAVATVRKEAQVATFDKRLITSLKKVGLRTAPL
jgi:predicted nucleic-acid-binding protein